MTTTPKKSLAQTVLDNLLWCKELLIAGDRYTGQLDAKIERQKILVLAENDRRLRDEMGLLPS